MSKQPMLLLKSKYGNRYFEATNKSWAYGEIFKLLDIQECYVSLPKDERELYLRAKQGDLAAAAELCRKRSGAGCEYETLTNEWIETPEEEL